MTVFETEEPLLVIDAERLSKGLRPFKNVPKNSSWLTRCVGAVGLDSMLVSVNTLTNNIDTSVVTDGFPYPQLFVFTNLIIVCGRTKIYEVSNGVLSEKLTVSAGYTWNVIDFYDYVYMSNGRVAVKRDAGSFEYSITALLPTASALCNYNGQVVIGAPGVVSVNDVLTPTKTSLSLVSYAPTILIS